MTVGPVDVPDHLQGFAEAVSNGKVPESKAFCSRLLAHVREHGYCVLNGSGTEVQREEIARLCDARKDAFERPRQEVRQALLGRDSFCKAWFLEATGDSAPRQVEPYFKQVSDLHMALCMLSDYELGFTPRDSLEFPLVRAALAGRFEARRLDSGKVRDSDLRKGLLENHLRFAQTRRLCIMYIIRGECSLRFFPRVSEEDYDTSSVRLQQDELIVFDHQSLTYECRLTGEEPLALQGWLSASERAAEEDVRIIMPAEEVPVGPLGPGLRTLISGFAIRCSGGEIPDNVQQIFLSNLDGYVRIPSARFDLDLYFSEDGELGTTRTQHSGLIPDGLLMSFDPGFFGISDEVAEEMEPNTRVAMEVGYECLFHCKLRKKDVEGKLVSYYLGSTATPAGMYAGRPAHCSLPYFLGLTGPCTSIDTACSSALVSADLAHQDCCLERVDAAMGSGVNTLLDVMPYIAMSSGRMISSRGRSRTFDHTADGYGRGEGIYSVLFEPASGRLRDGNRENLVEWGRVAASKMNQDGRSASITAPSGPSQSACILACIREAGLSAAEITFGECHGTGTSLGDPIEVGSSRMVMDQVIREDPYVMGAAKSNVGHLEIGAGTVGLVKLIYSMNCTILLPNCHLYKENEHFQMHGFPLHLATESFRPQKDTNIGGVSSFGFGGTNARMELLCQRKAFTGAKTPASELKPLMAVRTCRRCLGPMCASCGEALRDDADARRHRCTTLREDTDSYDVCSLCYEGAYAIGSPAPFEFPEVSGQLYVTGSWDDFASLRLVRPFGGEYIFGVTLGPDLCCRFALVVDGDRTRRVHPVRDGAGRLARIEGPDASDFAWCIDGAAEGALEGSHFKVRLRLSGGRRISWAQVLPQPRPAFLEDFPEQARLAEPKLRDFPAPEGRLFGKDGKMKLLYLHGGGVNMKVAQLQTSSLIRDLPMRKDIEWIHWTGPHAVPFGWNADWSLEAFGPDFNTYFERLPYNNCQYETWEGFDETLALFKGFLEENGPFDGVVGFDQGGEFIAQVAARANEGDESLAEAFRFLILFTSTAPKHLSPLGRRRPATPLRLPALLSWCDGDPNHPFQEYEELPLFFHRDFREVIRHDDGHQPPRFRKGTEAFNRFVRFLEAMQEGDVFIPSDNEENRQISKLFLPLSRSTAAPRQTPKRRLLVSPVPGGASDEEVAKVEAIQDALARGEVLEYPGEPFVRIGSAPNPLGRAQLMVELCNVTAETFAPGAGDVSVDGVTFSEEQRTFDWHCKADDVPTPQLGRRDIILDERQEAVARDWAKGWAKAALDKASPASEAICIVGFLTGSFLALAVARAMIEEFGVVPAALFLVDPTPRLPWSTTAMPAVLRDCPVRVLVDGTATYGPPWRYEVSTTGDFSMSQFKDVQDVVQQVLDGVRQS